MPGAWRTLLDQCSCMFFKCRCGAGGGINRFTDAWEMGWRAMAVLWHALKHHEGATHLARGTSESSVRRAGRLLADSLLRTEASVQYQVVWYCWVVTAAFEVLRVGTVYF